MSGRDAAGGGLITWAHPSAAKKWPFSALRKYSPQLDISSGKWSASAMADRIFRLDRRELMAGLGAAALGPALPAAPLPRRPRRPGAAGQSRRHRLASGAAGYPDLVAPGPAPDAASRFKRGDELEITLRKRSAGPGGAELARHRWRAGRRTADWRGHRSPPGARESLVIPLRHAGTFLCDLRLLGDGQARPSPARALIVGGKRAGRGRPRRGVPDRGLAAARRRNRDRARHRSRRTRRRSTPSTGRLTPGHPGRAIHERLRLRFINGCQRNVIAVKIEGHEVRVMALDGQPAEPFPARNGALVLAPGGRADVFIDARRPPGSISAILLHDGKEARPIARLVASSEPPIRPRRCPPPPPLPSNGLPAQLDLKNALRVEVALGGAASRLGDARELRGLRRARVPRQGRPHRGAGADQSRRRSPPSSTSTAIISGCWTGSTTAGSRSGWIRWRSSPGRPSASPLPPNMPAAG